MQDYRDNLAAKVIGIHNKRWSYSDRWISFCQKNNINYVVLDIYDSDFLSKIRYHGITHFLFHLGALEYRADIYLKYLAYLLEKEGVKVFPGFKEYWHYDDKVKQKYLFEQVQIPHAKMHVLYKKDDALEWISDELNYPFVFKLRNGFRSNNVRLVKRRKEARRLVKKMFGKGIKAAPSLRNEVISKWEKRNSVIDKLKFIKDLPRMVSKYYSDARRYLSRERGYFLAQKFIPGLDKDFRLKVVNNTCWGLIRYTRENDFRASGSDIADYDQKKIPIELVELSFQIAEKLEMQSVAFDFVYDGKEPLLLEVSYCYGIDEEQLNGYWTRDLKFHKGYFRPEHLIIESLLG